MQMDLSESADICWSVQKFNNVSFVSGSNNPETFLTSTLLNSYLNPRCFTFAFHSFKHITHADMSADTCKIFHTEILISDHTLIET